MSPGPCRIVVDARMQLLCCSPKAPKACLEAFAALVSNCSDRHTTCLTSNRQLSTAHCTFGLPHPSLPFNNPSQHHPNALACFPKQRREAVALTQQMHPSPPAPAVAMVHVCMCVSPPAALPAHHSGEAKGAAAAGECTTAGVHTGVAGTQPGRGGEGGGAGLLAGDLSRRQQQQQRYRQWQEKQQQQHRHRQQHVCRAAAAELHREWDGSAAGMALALTCILAPALCYGFVAAGRSAPARSALGAATAR